MSRPGGGPPPGAKRGARGNVSSGRRWKLSLDARAIAQGWDVPVTKRARLIRELMAIAFGKESAPREKIRAIEALLRVPGLQLEAARTRIEQQKWQAQKSGGIGDLDTILHADGSRNNEGPGSPGEVSP